MTVKSVYIEEQSRDLLALDLFHISYVFLRKCQILWFTWFKSCQDDFLR